MGQGVEMSLGCGAKGEGGVKDDPGVSPRPLGARRFSHAEPVAA